MQLSILGLALAALVCALAAPQYDPPPGGFDRIKYPEDTGANLPYYPPLPGGWEKVQYPPGTSGSPPASV